MKQVILKSKNKCKLKDCIQNEKGICYLFIPTCINESKPNSIKCFFYSRNQKEENEWLKNVGGINAFILSKYGKRTDTELKNIQKSKRKSTKKKK